MKVHNYSITYLLNIFINGACVQYSFYRFFVIVKWFLSNSLDTMWLIIRGVRPSSRQYSQFKNKQQQHKTYIYTPYLTNFPPISSPFLHNQRFPLSITRLKNITDFSRITTPIHWWMFSTQNERGFCLSSVAICLCSGRRGAVLWDRPPTVSGETTIRQNYALRISHTK